MWTLFILPAFFTMASCPPTGFPEKENDLTAQSEKTYRYSGFRPGIVHFRNGTRTVSPLNYNYQFGQFQFIDFKKDTLLLLGKERIDRIEIGEAVFYLNEAEGDFELIQKFGEVALVQKSQWTIAGDKSNHSNQKFSSGQANLPTSLFVSTQGGKTEWFNNTSDPAYKIKSTYYLRDYNHRFHEATRKSFLKIYARQRGQLKAYFQKNKVDFKSEVDLIALLNYCYSML